MARKSTLPYRLQPMLATLTDSPFDDPDWVFEDKFDGFRMVAEIRGGRVALSSRNGGHGHGGGHGWGHRGGRGHHYGWGRGRGHH